MKSREERKALHRTPSRRVRTDSVTKSTNATNIVKKGGRIYQETTIDGQKVYNEVQTSPSAENRTSNTSTIENLSITTVNTGGGAAPDSNVEDHSRLHDINSSLDHTGTLSVAKGGTGVTSSTGSTNTVLSTSPTFETSITIDQDNGESALVLHRDGANPSSSTAIGRIKFNQDYESSAEEWGRIQLQTTSSAARTKLGFWVKQTEGSIAEALTILGHDSGSNVGIGTTSPDQQFHLEGGNALIQAGSGASKDGYIYLGADSGDNIGATIRYQQSGDKLGFRISHSGDDNITLLSSGNVGIGEPSPDTTLEVLSTTNQLKLSYANGTDCAFGVNTDGYLTITPSGSKVLIANDDNIGSATHSTDWGDGNGWVIEDSADSGSHAHFDNLTIRGTMSVYELLIQQIRATNGNVMITSSAKVESSSGLADNDDNGTITFEPAIANTCPFVAGDIILCQQVNPGALVAADAASSGVTGLIKKMVYRVASVTNNICTVTNISGGGETAFNNTETNGPVAGDEFVRIGNYDDSTYESRQSVMYLTSDDASAPYIGMKANLNSYYDWTQESSNRLRLGRLDGLDAGGTNEYGLWAGPSSTNYIKASNVGVFIKGSEATYISATANKIEFYDVAPDTDSYKKMDITGGNIRMYKDDGITVVSEWDSETIHLGNQNHEHIEITNASLKIIDDETDRVVIDSSGITIGKFSADASGDITVDDISLNGMITAIGAGGRKNVCIGTGNSDDGNTNICIGVNAGSNLTSYADRNIFIGEEAGSQITGTSAVNTGDDNICIGYKSGSDSEQVETTIGRRNIYIGTSATGGANNTYNEVAIGYNITGKGDNTVNIGGPDTTQFWLGTDADTSVYNMNGKIMTGRAEVTSTNSTSTDATICLFRGTGRSDFAMGTETWHIVNDDSASDNFGIRRQTGGSSQVLTIAQDGSIDALCDASVDSFTFKNTVSDLGSNDVVDIWSNDSDHSTSAPWYYLSCYADEDASDDREFALRGNGYGYNDGTWHANDADYAEMFEWEDGNSSNEDRRGMTVVLVGDKIRLATDSDNDNDILGIVSVQPAVLGRTKWNKWQGKYQRDKWGQVVIVDGVRQLNSDFNASTTYQPRTERKEWDAIGLLGCLRMISGQPTRSSWKKMRDIQDNIEEWFIR